MSNIIRKHISMRVRPAAAEIIPARYNRQGPVPAPYNRVFYYSRPIPQCPSECINVVGKAAGVPRTELESIGVDGTGTSLIRYDYKNGNGRLKSMTYANGNKMKATYNALGQMIAETWYDINNTVTAKYKYVYDTEGNIVRSIDIVALKEYNYIYDSGKLVRALEYNITLDSNYIVNTRTVFSTVFYTYDSEDNMTKKRIISVDGQAIVYDAQGNPKIYLGHNLKWEKGRQLKEFDNFKYTYNANGIRTTKDINHEIHKYDLEGTKILRETWEDANHTVHTIVPLYDNEDSVCGITYNGTTYFFVKNLQGYIISLLDTNGKTVVRYRYKQGVVF